MAFEKSFGGCDRLGEPFIYSFSIAVITSLLAICTPSTTLAADYSAGVNLGANVSHDDNIQLNDKNKTSVLHYAAVPSFIFRANTETSSVSLNSVLSFNRYDKSTYNSDDQDITLSMEHDFEKSSISLQGEVNRTTTLVSEPSKSGQIGDGAGRLELYTLSPAWTYNIGESDTLKALGTGILADYRVPNYTGYKELDGELDWIHNFNERWAIVGAGTYSEYQSEDIISTAFVQFLSLTYPVTDQKHTTATRTKTQGAQIGVYYQASEANLLKIQLGESKSSTDYPAKVPSNLCAYPLTLYRLGLPPLNVEGKDPYCDSPVLRKQLSTANITWTWSGERQQISSTLSKAAKPNSDGSSLDQTQLAATWTYSVSELDQLITTVAAVRNRELASSASTANASSVNRNYVDGKLLYRHRIGEHWYLDSSFQYRHQKYLDVSADGTSHTFFVGIQYQPQDWHWSR